MGVNFKNGPFVWVNSGEREARYLHLITFTIPTVDPSKGCS